MRILVLTILLATSIVAVMFYAQHLNNDSTHPNHVPHPAGAMLAVNFAHADHIAQTCISCHHNYVDDTGIGMCFDCHKTDEQVADLLEEQFHGLCRECHVGEQIQGMPHGPTRSCIACHVPDEQP